MRTLNENQYKSLFRHQVGSHWVGGVHMMNKYYEYVPFTLDGNKHVMAFYYPQYWNGDGLYSDLLLKTEDGGYFATKRDHRHIKLFSLDNTMTLKIMSDVQVSQIEQLAQALCQVICTYYQETPQTNQFFFEAEPKLGNFISSEIPPLAEKLELTMRVHDELSAPFYGFSLFKKYTV
ncbi:hypothetical protein [Vibrio lentus]|uniref:Uncharacterized protein n=1 Tax=Vibrio lentus TaxID=136468 RepID=A0A2N7BND4_9VIBR|nr:hypothetical protein [Vibrio lentus]PME47924.1 hypothetical protein BCV34_16975 [Vibrio lentus]PME60090.1 hypothetical protein BCV30_13410 [Vibrio lentus]PME77227.1 hypothetical protein BCV27_03030 [Vibrio lentus]PMH89765.1 hypothetical protein BCU56_18810 [Vibrio lentus]PMI04856.1 hypothetical protein BCU53_15375 [Vibrio lentus]